MGGYLHGFPQTHLIREDAIQPSLVHGHQPLQPNVLVLPQLVPQKKWHLGLHLGGREGEGEGRRERECMQLYDSVLEQALSYCTSVVANVIPLG